MCGLSYISLLWLVVSVQGRGSLLTNGQFEQPLEGHWGCEGRRCVYERTNVTSFAGSYSVRVFNRSGSNYGLEQSVRTGIKPSSMYYLSGRIKMDTQDSDYHKLEAWIRLKGGSSRRFNIARSQFVRSCEGWVLIGGDFTTRSDTTEVVVSIMVSDTDKVDYFIDDVNLEEIPADEQWKSKANERIDRLRKAQVTLRIEVNGSINAEDIIIQVNQTKQLFPIGASIGASWMYRTDAVARRYQNYVYDLFNWFTFGNDAKWRMMERREGRPDFQNLGRAFKAMSERNVTNIRGHCIVWGRAHKIVSWLTMKDAQEVKDSVARRVSYLANRFGSKFLHWDVNNENMHDVWYERRTNNPRFSQDLFHQMYDLNPESHLFINDFLAVSGNLFTSSLTKMGATYLQQGVPIRGIGVQSHLSGKPNIHLVKHRLDMLSTAGLPIWITELDIRNIANDSIRADTMEDVLRLYLSHPLVAGVILWTWWSSAAQWTDAVIVNGNNFTENDVGRRVRHLIKDEWRTQLAIPLSDASTQTQIFRAFYGTYDLQVRHQGQALGQVVFDVRKGKNNVIDLMVNENGVHINSDREQMM